MYKSFTYWVPTGNERMISKTFPKCCPSIVIFLLLKYYHLPFMDFNFRLSELRDHIKCAADLMVAGDVSNEPPWKDKLTKMQRALALGPLPASRAKFAPRAIRKPMAKEVYKSGFFYIEGCFYNDMRWPGCIDYR